MIGLRELAMTETADIVERLRACANGIGSLKTELGDYGICDEAAAEITRLRAALAARIEECAKVAEEMAVLAQSLASATENNHMRDQRIAESAQSLSIAAAIRSITP